MHLCDYGAISVDLFSFPECLPELTSLRYQPSTIYQYGLTAILITPISFQNILCNNKTIFLSGSADTNWIKITLHTNKLIFHKVIGKIILFSSIMFFCGSQILFILDLSIHSPQEKKKGKEPQLGAISIPAGTQQASNPSPTRDF